MSRAVGANFKRGHFHQYISPIGATVMRANLSKVFNFLNFKDLRFDQGLSQKRAAIFFAALFLEIIILNSYFFDADSDFSFF